MNVIWFSTAVLLLGFASFSSQDEKTPLVKTSLGNVKGYYKTSRRGRRYEAYEGIPYAQPPVRELRFESPVPVQAWNFTLMATKKGSVCMQYLTNPTPEGDLVTGCEDCLYLNIYVPVIRNNYASLPVMFWIHAGAYQLGSGNKANETLIMDRNVIFVTVNYRLGPFGFLSTGNSIVPGNMGLKDQTLALRWVNDHIVNFGGNPRNITIFGLSAGAASVHYHYLSPLSAGLFQRGISGSGVALDPWAQTERAPEKSKKLGALVGCPTRNVNQMIKCLKQYPPRVIARAVVDFMPWLNSPFTPFGPVVEQPGPKSFISLSPIDVINRGEAYDVPWISGIVSEEGLFPGAEFIEKDDLLKQLNDDWNEIAPYLLDYNDTIPVARRQQVGQKIRKHYLGSRKINSKTVTSLIYMLGDRNFVSNYRTAIRLQASINESPVWNYFYSYRSLHSFSEVVSGGSTKNYGVSHGDDMYLVLDTAVSNTHRPQDLKMQQLLLDFYTSFAINGVPSIGKAKWQTFNPEEKQFQHLHIAKPDKINMERIDEDNFWSTINFDENKIHS